MDRKRQKLIPEKNAVEKECQDEKIKALERKLVHMKNKLKLVTAELEQVKEERVRDRINFETEKCQLKSVIDKHKEQCTKSLQSENGRFQKYLQNLESAKTNLDEKSQINICNTGIDSRMTRITESNDDTFNINSLPDEIIVEVFRYLDQKKLGQIARVCKRWNELAKDPVLWKEVNVRFFRSHRCQSTAAKSLIDRLPSCVTSVTLYFGNVTVMYPSPYISNVKEAKPLDFAEFCLKLQKFPRFEKLMLIYTELSESLSSVADICAQLLHNVKSLAFHGCKFLGNCPRIEFSGTSKIEMLELSCCEFSLSDVLEFSRMPYLKVLHLYNTKVYDSWFQNYTSFFNQLQVLNLEDTRITARTLTTVKNHGFNLKELYICLINLKKHDLNFNNLAFPLLETICLRSDGVTCNNIVSVIQSCPSLQNVYVKKHIAKSLAVHPFFVANRCKSGLVKAIPVIHRHNVHNESKWIYF